MLDCPVALSRFVLLFPPAWVCSSSGSEPLPHHTCLRCAQDQIVLTMLNISANVAEAAESISVSPEERELLLVLGESITMPEGTSVPCSDRCLYFLQSGTVCLTMDDAGADVAQLPLAFVTVAHSRRATRWQRGGVGCAWARTTRILWRERTFFRQPRNGHADGYHRVPVRRCMQLLCCACCN